MSEHLPVQTAQTSSTQRLVRTPQIDIYADVDTVLGGNACQNTRGTYYQIHRTDDNCSSDLLKIAKKLNSVLPLIREKIRYNFTLEDMLFIDIETTALRSSSPMFLIGILQLAPLCFQQFIARSHTEEKAILEALTEFLPKKVLISFNGHYFDWPYIYQRSLFHQIALPKAQAHFDLLPYARKHWQQHLPDCRLQTLERQFCGRYREGDISGASIPNVYQQFCQIYEKTRQGAHLIFPIVYHNYWDLVTTAELFSKIAD